MLKLVAGIGGGESPVDGCRSLISFGYLSKIAGRGTSAFSSLVMIFTLRPEVGLLASTSYAAVGLEAVDSWVR